jgi:hypothetical protein
MAALTYRPSTVNAIVRCCAICAAALVLGLAGCGDDEEQAATTPATTATVNETPTVPETRDTQATTSP